MLFGGIVLLVVNSGSDEPEAISTPRIAEVNDPDEPLVETTVPPVDSVAEVSAPLPTSPPLIAPPVTTITDPPTVPDPPLVTDPPTVTDPTTPPTQAPDPGGPTQERLDGALLRIDDIGPGNWTEEVPETDDVCGEIPDPEVPDARADAVFQSILQDPFGVRQITNSLITYASVESAERAFDADVALLVNCNATTVDVEGVPYRVQVNNDAFTDEQSAEFPCADQSAFLLVQLFNDDALVPYLGVSAVSFRCGRNVTVTALSTSIDIEDLGDDNFFEAASISNIRTGALPGS